MNMKNMNMKKSFPLGRVYTLLEPGPVTLLTTAAPARSKFNVMTMSWHSMLDFEPPLVGCVISDANYSFRLLQSSGECVINIPTAELAEQVVGCGNTRGARLDKFRRFGLTAVPARRVSAPLIHECFASLECRVTDTSLVARYGFFVLEVVQAWVDRTVREPRTLHHRGYGEFMLAGETLRLKSGKK